jgi:hypothetical protein
MRSRGRLGAFLKQTKRAALSGGEEENKKKHGKKQRCAATGVVKPGMHNVGLQGGAAIGQAQGSRNPTPHSTAAAPGRAPPFDHADDDAPKLSEPGKAYYLLMNQLVAAGGRGGRSSAETAAAALRRRQLEEQGDSDADDDEEPDGVIDEGEDDDGHDSLEKLKGVGAGAEDDDKLNSDDNFGADVPDQVQIKQALAKCAGVVLWECVWGTTTIDGGWGRRHKNWVTTPLCHPMQLHHHLPAAMFTCTSLSSGAAVVVVLPPNIAAGQTMSRALHRHHPPQPVLLPSSGPACRRPTRGSRTWSVSSAKRKQRSWWHHPACAGVTQCQATTLLRLRSQLVASRGLGDRACRTQRMEVPGREKAKASPVLARQGQRAGRRRASGRWRAIPSFRQASSTRRAA